jgi:hypothetical protein
MRVVSSEGQEIKIGNWVAYPKRGIVARGQVRGIKGGGMNARLEIAEYNGDGSLDEEYSDKCLLLQA